MASKSLVMTPVLLLALGFLVATTQAGSGADNWGIDTLINLPPGKARLTVPNQAGDSGIPDPIELPCQCSDADPRDGVTQDVQTDCFFQRVFNNCQADFMFDTNAELLPEGACQMSCDRCSCCSPANRIIDQLGGNRFMQALEAAQPNMKDLFSNPGLAVTILVPNNDAWDAATAKYGSLLQNPDVLQQVIKFHVIPPEPVVKGLWTSPFMSRGAVLYPLYDGPEKLTVPAFDMPSGTSWRGGLTGFTIKGPHNSAKVLKSDVMSCKSYINVIDTVLLPFDPASPPPNNDGGVAAVVGAGRCTVKANSVIRGSDAGTSTQETVGDCCSACEATSGCNAWTYCSQEGGCLMPTGQVIAFGNCNLKRSQELQGGNPPWFEDVNAVTVPLVSGYIGGQGPPVASSG